MRLFLCEKPDQARELAPLLGSPRRGDGFIETAGGTLTWAIGHLLTQAPPEAYHPDWKRWTLATLPMLPEQWQVVPYADKTAQVTVIKRLLAKASTVVIATDCGREGELIARELLDYAGYRGPIQRLWYSALDEASLRKALADIRPGTFSEPLYRSALARQRADWLVGLNLTRAASIVLSVPGKPRPPAEIREDVRCPQCGGPTRYLKGRSKVRRKPYEFFGCADRACKGTVAARGGKPLQQAG